MITYARCFNDHSSMVICTHDYSTFRLSAVCSNVIPDLYGRESDGLRQTSEPSLQVNRLELQGSGVTLQGGRHSISSLQLFLGNIHRLSSRVSPSRATVQDCPHAALEVMLVSSIRSPLCPVFWLAATKGQYACKWHTPPAATSFHGNVAHPWFLCSRRCTESRSDIIG